MYFTQGLHRALQQSPDAIATICNGRQRTYRELARRVAAMAAGMTALVNAMPDPRPPSAARLSALGAAPRIAILSLNSDTYIETYLACAWIGAIIIPVNYRWSANEIAFALQDSQAELLLVDAHHATQALALQVQCPSLRHIVELGATEAAQTVVAGERLINDHAPIPDTRTGDEALFGLFYTGGTTGRSKGVMLSHKALLASAHATLGAGPFGAGAVSLHVAPMFHLADMLLLTSTLIRGGTHVIAPSFDPGEALSLIARHKVTDVLLVPAMLNAIVNSHHMPGADLSSLRYLLYGASPAPTALLKQALTAMPHVNLMQGYGMTDTAALISFLPPDAHRQTARPQLLRAAGRPALHVEVRVVDKAGAEAARGDIGEITCRGPNLMQGYLGLDSLTADAIRDGWLHTGDLGYMDEDGFIYIVDRAKDMIISGGENVYTAEVENAVATHPAIAGVAAFGIPDPNLGEAVHVSVVLRPGQEVTLRALQDHCRTMLAGYKLPRSIEAVQALPISGAGKILKTTLRAPYWADRDRNVN